MEELMSSKDFVQKIYSQIVYFLHFEDRSSNLRSSQSYAHMLKWFLNEHAILSCKRPISTPVELKEKLDSYSSLLANFDADIPSYENDRKKAKEAFYILKEHMDELRSYLEQNFEFLLT